jgi:sterol desaturase/sphingolipid hydroxylase (fatty acid hydroxylase superfamily)
VRRVRDIRIPLRSLLPVAIIGAIVLAERWRPLRRAVEPGWRREARNLAVSLTAALAIRVAEKPLTDRFAGLVERRHIGALPRLGLPPAIETALALVLLDYTLYLWHVLLHRVPLLWRIHLVHHADLDLTASTALRFHFAEMVLSAPWRAAQVALVGVRPPVLALWQRAAFVEIVFHHANLRLPARLDRWLGHLVMTPRLHGIHHSTVREETDSNWSSGLVLWDRLHGTLRRDVPQRAIAIGVPACRDPTKLTLAHLLAMPFGPERPAWQPHFVSREGRAHDAAQISIDAGARDG